MKNSYSNIYTFNEKILNKLINSLKNGGVAGLPTETVYGLGGNAYLKKSVEKIFELKGRPKNNPLIIHYHNLNDAKNDIEINNFLVNLYRKFCPGPITFILKLKKNSNISKIVTNNKKTLAVRFPRHHLAIKLLKILKYPLAAPSANISSKISPVTKEDVKDEFGERIKFILDGGRSKIGLESTIVSLLGKPKILRLGGIERKRINKVLRKKILYKKNDKKIVVPGQLSLHYSPGIPIRLNKKKPKENEAFILIKKRKKTSKDYYYLSKKKDLKEAAKNLYKVLRNIKNKDYKSIAVEKIPNYGFGEAINERLKRASVK